MGSPNQRRFVASHRELFQPPVLEVGSKLYGEREELRTLFPGAEWLGLDMEAGAGVDLVADLTRPFGQVDEVLGGRRFQTIFCLSVLEHCTAPWLMAANLKKLLAPGGVLCVSAPFTWEVHGYPEDYWRFTPQGLKVLFPELSFAEELGAVSFGTEGPLRPVEPGLGGIRMSVGKALRAHRFGRAFAIGLLQLLRALHVGGEFAADHWLFPRTALYLIGRKPS
jgi:hypothetical protein